MCNAAACRQLNADPTRRRLIGAYTGGAESTSSFTKRAKEHILRHLEDERIVEEERISGGARILMDARARLISGERIEAQVGSPMEES